jgi:hypothetical protein
MPRLLAFPTPLLFVAALLAAGRPAHAQSLVSQLGALLTEQRAITPVFVPDAAAASATATTVAGLFTVEMSTLPIAASSGGFVYRLNPSLGLVERASDGFGPFFTERLLRNSQGQTSIGLSLQAAHFASLQGADLTTGTFPTNAARLTGATQAFSVDTLSLELDGRSMTGFVSHGLTDRLAIGAVVPLMQVRFTGERVRTTNGQSLLMSAQAGSSTGLGDVMIQGRYVLAGRSVRGVSIGSDLRLPTGSAEDLRGSGKAAWRVVGIGSWEENQLAWHANGGAGVGGASREIFWSTATTFAATPRITVTGEVMGRHLSELSLVEDVYEPHPLVPGVETMRWLPTEPGVHTMFVVAGAKWNLVSSWLLNTSLLIRVTDAGLRARVTPAISLDYAFEQ